MASRIHLMISGLGIIMYSPPAVRHIPKGADYLESDYGDPKAVQRHIQAGSLVGFGTSSPGDFHLDLHEAAPPDAVIDASEFKLRLGIKVEENLVCFKDLYALLAWNPKVPSGHTHKLPNGYYRITLCSNRPASGIIGDHQAIRVYFEKWDGMPRLAKTGVPTLCD
jgi:hypothetical protein